MIDLKKILLQKFQQRTLASFYLMKAPHSVTHKKIFLRQWVRDFLSACIQQHDPLMSQSLLLENHPDVLFINKSGPGNQGSQDDEKETVKEIKEGDYALKDFHEFFQFLSFKPFQFPHRFIVVEDVHLIGETLANKLLKSLEGPGDHLTIFFLQHQEKKLLPTLQSRSVMLKIPESPTDDQMTKAEKSPSLVSSQQKGEWISSYLENHPDFPESLSEMLLPALASPAPTTYYGPLIEVLKKNRENKDAFLRLLLDWECHHHSSFADKKKFLQELQWFEEAQTYYNAPGERFSSLLRTLLPSAL